MEHTLFTFLSDKNGFLQGVAEKKIKLSPLVTGLILSFTENEKFCKKLYLESLLQVINGLTENSHISYCFVKFYRIISEILKKQVRNSLLFNIFNEGSLKLSQINVLQHLALDIRQNFSLAYKLMLNLYSGTFEILTIVEIGAKNLKFFIDTPLVLTSPLLENLLKLNSLKKNYNFNEFLNAYKKIGQFIMKSSHPETLFISDFLFTLTESKCKSQEMEFLSFVQKNLDVLARCFNEENIEKLRNFLKKPRLFAEAPEFVPAFQELDKSSEFFKDENNESSHVLYENYTNLNKKLPVLEKSVQYNEETLRTLNSIFTDLYDYFKGSNYLDPETVQTQFAMSKLDSSSIHVLIMEVVLEKMNEYNSSKDSEFWIPVIEALKCLFTSNDLLFIQSAYPQFFKKPDLAKSSCPQNYNRRSRPPSRVSHSTRIQQNLYESHPKIDTIEFVPQTDKLVPIQPPYLPSMPSDPIQSDLSYNDYFEFLSISFADLLKSNSQEPNIQNFTLMVCELKQFILDHSPSATFNIIGSFFEETYVKSSIIDINFIDFLAPDPHYLLTLASNTLELGQYNQELSTLHLKSNIYLRFIINQELAQYNSVLIKSYNSIDSRCKDLIFIFKSWTVQERLHGSGFPSGFQINLLVIVFLQLVEPPVLPRFQLLPHEPKIICEADVWIPEGFVFSQDNDKNLAEIFHLFIRFLCDLAGGNYVADSKYGLVCLADFDGFLPVLAPFDHKVISECKKGSEQGYRFERNLKRVLQVLDNKGGFEQIFY